MLIAHYLFEDLTLGQASSLASTINQMHQMSPRVSADAPNEENIHRVALLWRRMSNTVKAYRNNSSNGQISTTWELVESRQFGIWDRDLGGAKLAHVLEQLALNGERGGWTNSNKLTLGRIKYAQTTKQPSYHFEVSWMENYWPLARADARNDTELGTHRDDDVTIQSHQELG